MDDGLKSMNQKREPKATRYLVFGSSAPQCPGHQRYDTGDQDR